MLLFGIPWAIGHDSVVTALTMLIGAPITLAHAVVFSFVADRIYPQPPEKNGGNLLPIRPPGSDVAGTPWERNPSHTRDMHDTHD